ncbi:winged helix-turn-helix transcriptional regulator [bacterium]|nr:MAG: winged helix-turn-helix transcriptional regulator [bacterium]
MKKLSNKLEFLMNLSKAQAIISRKLHGQGLGFGDLVVLNAISQADGGKIRRVDLAEQVGLTASAVTRILIPLEKIGVVKRESGEHDARVGYTSLTTAGKELFEDTIKWTSLKCEDLLSGQNEKDLAQMSEVLKTIS